MSILIYFFVFDWINDRFVCKGTFFRIIIEKVRMRFDMLNIFRANYVRVFKIKEGFFYIIFLFFDKIFYVIDEGVYIRCFEILLFF